ncbi:Interleukin-10 [Pelobates cultripes]|uniref:Interleukin family protein n=2 Tax=Pelobates cultripes TaxID=61616 RepID=A0AAD1VLP8_PELCU|nr:Interleukin-10 [Pelobates cultripes]
MKFFIILLILAYKEVNSQSGDTEGNCQRVVNIFPAKLKELRTSFQKVKNYFQMKDNALEVILLQDNLLNDFKSSLGCQSVIEMIKFYLEDVLPRASSKDKSVKSSVSIMNDKLLDLKQTLRRCHHFLPCDRKSKAIKQIKETYSKMKEHGIYKAMGEFDIFIDYIEEYLSNKKK